MTATFNGLESMLFAIEAERAELSAINAKLHDNHKKATRRVEVRTLAAPAVLPPQSAPKETMDHLRTLSRCTSAAFCFDGATPCRAVPDRAISGIVLHRIVVSCRFRSSCANWSGAGVWCRVLHCIRSQCRVASCCTSCCVVLMH